MAIEESKIPEDTSPEYFSFVKSCKKNIFLLLFLLGAIFSTYYAIQGWNGSLLEMFAFRQTQTAITVQYMLHGGPLLKYETPLLGPPWAIPLEFPFYQFVVFLLVKLSGYPLDPAGRLVSLFFFISALYPFYSLIKPYFADNSRAFIALLLLCVSPQYLYWSRTFMIESTALSLSLWYLFLIKKMSDRDEHSTGNLTVFVLILVTGILASITKVTTFLIYYCLGALFLSARFYQLSKQEKLSAIIKKNMLIIIIAIIIPLLSTFIWTLYTDQIKALNPIGAKLTSTALKQWTFGTMEQKLSLAKWASALSRSLKDLIGNLWLFGATFALLPFCRKRTAGIVLFLFFLFLLPIAVFSNLYFVHSYYFYANGILLLLALALVLGDLSVRSTPWFVVSIALLLLTSISSGRYYLQNYYPMQGNVYRDQDMKYYVDRYTKHDDVLLFFGADWSAEMPYYLERRSLMLPKSLTTTEIYRQAIEKIRAYPVGGVFLCNKYRSQENKFSVLNDVSKLFPSGFKPVSFTKCDAYFQVNGENP